MSETAVPNAGGAKMGMAAKAARGGALGAASGAMATVRGSAALAGQAPRTLGGTRAAPRASTRAERLDENAGTRARGARHLRAAFGLVFLAFAVLSAPPAKAQNSAATGKPTVSGTARVAELLTASTTGIADANGITRATFSYQWIRVDGMEVEDIDGATEQTYRPVPADQGKKLQVKVSFTDDDDNDEMVESDPTGTIGDAVTVAATCAGGHEVWSSTLTVGKFSGTNEFLGASRVGYGTIANVDITDGTHEYEVWAIVLQVTGSDAGTLTAQPRRDNSGVPSLVTADNLLCLGNDTLEFVKASTKIRNDDILRWSMSGLEWFEGAKMQVKIVEKVSNNATLSALAVTDGTNDLSFDHPSFASGTTRYYLSVANTVTTLTVVPTTSRRGAEIAYLDARAGTISDQSTDEGLQARLSEGRNVIQVRVTSTDGTNQETYTIEVGRAAARPTAACDALWCANLTLGLDSASAGYEPDSGSSSQTLFGGLAPTTFTLDGDTFTVSEISWPVGADGDGRGDVAVTVDRDLPHGEYILEIATRTLEVYLPQAEAQVGEEVPLSVIQGYPRRFGEVVLVKLYRDETPPAFESAIVDEDQLVVTFDEALDPSKTPVPDAFTVMVDGVRVTASTVSISGTDVTLALASEVDGARTESVTVAYAKPSSGNTLQDRSGNEVATFSAQSVTIGNLLRRGPVSEGFPPRPGSIIALPDGPHAIKLHWSAPIEGPRGVAGYWLELSDDGGFTWTDLVEDTGPVEPIGRTDFEYRDAPVQAGVTRWYRVSSLNRVGASEPMTVNEGTTATGAPVSGCRRQHAVWCMDVTFRGNSIYRRTRPPPITIDGKQYTSSYIQIHKPGATVAWAFIGRKVDSTLRNMVIWIDDLKLPFADAQLTPGETMAYWEIEGGVTLVDSAHFELVDSRGDIHAPEPERAYVFSDGLEVVLELSEPLDRSAGSLPASIVDDFALGFEGSERKVEFSSAVLSSAQDAEDATGNHNVLKALDRHEVRAIRLVLDAANRIERDEFVYVSYNGTDLADASGNKLVKFDIQRVVNGSDWRDGVKLAERATDFGSPNIFRLSISEPIGGTPEIRSERSTEFSNLRSLRSTGGRGTKGGIVLMSADDSPTVTVEPDTDEEWGPGDQVVVKVQYSRPVRVDTTGGTPTISLRVGETPLTATYTRGSGTDTLVFTATVPSDAPASNTVSVSANALSLNGAVIVSAQGQNAEIEHVAVERVLEPAEDALVASVKKKPDRHAGSGTFKVEIGFTKPITTDYALLPRGFTMTDGTIESARRVGGKSDHWVLTVRPDGTGDVGFRLAGGRPCSVIGAPCASGGGQLAETLEFTVPGPEEDASDAALTVWVDHAPKEHDGTNFDIRVKFSQEIINGYAYVAKATRVTNGTLRRARRHEGRHDMWVFDIDPQRGRGVVLILRGGGTCAGSKSPVICTSDGKVLSHTLVAQVKAQAQVSVADARAEEGVDETMDFRVYLDRPAYTAVTVDYATSDGTAKAGLDYTSKSGTVTFEEGEISKVVPVTILDDAIDEGEETFTFTLSNPVGIRIADGTATGTIENDDPLQKAWLARFGRTVGSHALEAGWERVAGSRETHVSIGGHSLAGEGGLTKAEADAMAAWLLGEKQPAAAEQNVSGRDLVLGSSFALSSGGENGAPRIGAWGRFAFSSFEGEENGVKLSGDVTSGFLGADVESGRWIGGLALGHSVADGPFELTSRATSTRKKGTVESTLTGAYPYLGFRATERLTVWGMGGLGSGTMTVTQEDDPGIETDISMQMGAIGAKGALLEAPPEGGFSLNLKSDVMHVEMESDAVSGSQGNMEGAKADVTRYRLILEGMRAFDLGGGAALTPALELGLRHDAGDAETGTGVEIGGRIAYTRGGFAIEGAARTLVAHEASGYEEWGASGSIRLSPSESGRGVAASLTPVWGTAGSGTGRLWGAADARGLAPDGQFEAKARIDGELGYGIGVNGHQVVTPYAGVSWAEEGGRTERLGARWKLAPGAVIGLENTRKHARGEEPGTNEVMLRTELRW